MMPHAAESQLLLRLVGGPAHGYQLYVPEAPPLLGVGHPIAHYRRAERDGQAVYYHYVVVMTRE
jgi:hypothetical protein